MVLARFPLKFVFLLFLPILLNLHFVRLLQLTKRGTGKSSIIEDNPVHSPGSPCHLIPRRTAPHPTGSADDTAMYYPDELIGPSKENIPCVTTRPILKNSPESNSPIVSPPKSVQFDVENMSVSSCPENTISEEIVESSGTVRLPSSDIIFSGYG